MLSNIVLITAKYLILIFFALFVFVSFRAQRDIADDKKKADFFFQRAFIYIIHAICFLCIIIHAANDDLSFTAIQAGIFYAGQLLYLIIMASIIPAVVALNKGLNNVMCMFIMISFVIQSRLNFQMAFRQFWILIAATVLFLIFVFFCKRITFLHRLTWLYCIIGLALLGAVLILASITKGAKLAIDFGSFSFQPMEFVKIIFVLFVAAAFNRANSFKTVIITAIIAAVHVIILVFCRDLGSALILFAIYVFMVYVATKKGRYILAGLAGFAAASFIAYSLFSHVRVRIQTWRDPWSDEVGGYQITQALFAIGTGGWFGAGIFGGAPGYVPEVTNDMVFSAIAEEFGGVFSLLLIFLCLCFAFMILRVSIRLEYVFYKLLAFGLGIAYIFQTFLNIGGTMKFIPLTGVNLPFISSGGSSLLSSMIMIGIIQALYVLSEADVKKEREALAQGVDIRQFYEEEKLTKDAEYDENTTFIDIDEKYREKTSNKNDRNIKKRNEKRNRKYKKFEEQYEYNDTITDDINDAYGYENEGSYVLEDPEINNDFISNKKVRQIYEDDDPYMTKVYKTDDQKLVTNKNRKNNRRKIKKVDVDDI